MQRIRPLGGDLLAAAGGNVAGFIVAIRASGEQLRTNKLDDGHAIAPVSRKGETLIVSNDTVVRDQDQAIGQDAVAWPHKNYPLIIGKGKTLHEAEQALAKEIAKHQSVP